MNNGCRLFLLVVLSAACQPINTAPTRADVRAAISGRVLLAAEPGLNDMSRVRVEIGKGEGGTTPDEDGIFQFSDLEPDVYELRVLYVGGLTSDASESAYQEYTRRVLLQEGGSVDVGDVQLALGLGSISGTLALNDEASTDGARAILSNDKLVREVAVVDGTYTFNEVPIGRYNLTVEKDGYALAQGGVMSATAAGDGTADGGPQAELGCLQNTLVAYHAQSVEAAAFRYTPTNVSLLPGIGETRSEQGADWVLDSAANTVTVNAVGGFITQARLWPEGEQPKDYLPFASGAGFEIDTADLSEGDNVYHLQFGGCRYESPVRTLNLILDRTPPQVRSLTVRGHAPNENGVIWLREDAPTLTVEVMAEDAQTSVTGIALVHHASNEAPASDALVFDEISGQNGLIIHADQVGLSTGDGAKNIYAFLRDAAGNINAGETLTASLRVDTTPPQLSDAVLSVTNAEEGNVLSAMRAALAFDLSTEDEVPTQMRVGVFPLPSAGPFEPFVSSKWVSFVAQHGEQVKFAAEVKDAAGNVTALTTANYVLDLSGSLMGRVLVEDVPADVAQHGGVAVRLFEAEMDPASDAALLETTTNPNGGFTLGPIPEGPAYQLELWKAGMKRLLLPVPQIAQGAVSTVGTVVMEWARGNIRGVFRKANSPSNSSGIVVTASLNGRTTQTVTNQDGSYEFPFPGLPVTAGNERYRIQAFAEGHIPASIEGLQVLEASTSAVNPDPEDASLPLPVELAELSGDFDICAPEGECLPLQHTNLGTVRVRLRVTDGVTDLRLRAREAFEPDDASLPWQGSFSPEAVYTVALDGEGAEEGETKVYVQVKSEGVAAPLVMQATVVYDLTPPNLEAFGLQAGEGALAENFTNAAFARVTGRVEPASEGEAPLASVKVAFSETPITNAPQNAVTCSSLDSPCNLAFPVDEATGLVREGQHQAYAFACDRANNCSTATEALEGVNAASIVHDRSAPLLLAEDWALQSSYLTTYAGTRYLRAGGVTLKINLGNVDVYDGAGEKTLSVNDVAAYRVAAVFVGDEEAPTTYVFDNANIRWRDVNCPSANATDCTVQNLTGPVLVGEDGLYRVFAQFKDAAGNVTAQVQNPHTADLVLDTEVPGVTFALNGGNRYTTESSNATQIQDSDADPVVTAWFTLDGGLFNEKLVWDLTTYVADDALDLAALLDGGGAVVDGVYQVTARFFDAAGNSADRMAEVVLDTQAPEMNRLVVGDGSGFVTNASGDVLMQVSCVDAMASQNELHVEIENVTETATELLYGGAHADFLTVGLGLQQGARNLVAHCTDPAGNVSEGSSTQNVTLDYTPPTVGPFTINGGTPNEPTRQQVATLHFTDESGASVLTDNLSGVAALSVSETVMDCNNANYAYAAQDAVNFVLSPSQGEKRLFVCLRDLAGNVTAASEAANKVVFDSIAPAPGLLTLAGGAPYVTSPTGVALAVQTSENAPSVILNGDLDEAGTYAWADLPQTLTLTGAQGLKTVRVQLEDAAGNRSDVFWDDVYLDSEAPGQVVAISPRANARFSNSTPFIRWTPVADVSEYRLTLDGQVITVPRTEWQSSNALGEGAHTWQVQAVDAAGNVGALHESFPRTFHIDTVLPTGLTGLSLSGANTLNGTDYVPTATPTFNWVGAQDDQTSAGNLKYSFEVARDAAFQETVLQVALTGVEIFSPEGILADGNYRWRLTVLDEAGNASTVEGTPFVVDTQAAAGAVAIEAGAAYTNSVNVNVTVDLEADVSSLALAVGNDCAQANSVALQANHSLVLAQVQGVQTVTACYTDQAGNTSSASASITLDTVAPAGTFTLNGGASFATSVQVDGQFETEVDDVVAISVLESTLAAGPCAEADFSAVLAGQASYGVTLSLSPEETSGTRTKTVRLCVQDLAGNVGSFEQQIVLDTEPPKNLSVTFEPGLATNVPVVKLLLEASDVHQMRVEGDLEETPSWRTFENSYEITLSAGEGMKNVRVRFRDEAGNETAPLAAQINLDQTAPSLSDVRLIGYNVDGTQNTDASATTALTLGAVAYGAEAMAISPTEIDCSNSAVYEYPVAYLTEVNFADANVGTAEFWVCVRDAAGNTAGPLSDEIALDFSPPTCSISRRGYSQSGELLSNNFPKTAQSRTRLQFVGCSELPVEVSAVTSTTGIDCQTASYQRFQSMMDVQIPAVEGVTQIRACFKDGVGNVTASSVNSTTFTVDFTGPQYGTLLVARQSESEAASHVNTSNVHAYVTATDADEMRLSRSANFSVGGDWEPYSVNVQTVNLGAHTDCNNAPQGVARTVYAQFKDDVGNLSETLQYSLILDKCSPATPSVALNGNPSAVSNEYANDPQVNVAITNVENADRLLIYANNSSSSCGSSANASPFAVVSQLSYEFGFGDGRKRLCVAAEDLAGNVSGAGSDTIIIDTVPPTAPVLSPSNSNGVNQSCANIQPSASSSLDANFWKWQRRQSGEDWEDVTPNAQGKINFSLLQDTDNFLEVRALDRAGNIGDFNTVFVEEVSSRFYATSLDMKMICDGGAYVILRDHEKGFRPLGITLGDPVSGIYPTIGGVTAPPNFSLFHIEDFEEREISGPTGMAAAFASDSYYQYSNVLDAACAVEQEALLVTHARPKSVVDGLERLETRQYVIPQPFGASVGSSSFHTYTGTGGTVYIPMSSASGEGTDKVLGIQSIDVLDWTGTAVASDPDTWGYRAVAVDNIYAIVVSVGIRRLYSSNTRVVTAYERYDQKWGGLAHHFKGLSLWGSSRTVYLRWDGNSWEIERSSTHGTEGTSLYSFPANVGFSSSESPWGSHVKPASFVHWSTISPQEARTNSVYVDATGAAKAIHGGNDGTTILASGAGTDTFPAFTDDGYRTVDWADAANAKRVRRNDTYSSTSSLQDFRYAVDTGKPIFSTQNTGAGESFIIYHTSDSERGIVVGYANESGCLGD